MAETTKSVRLKIVADAGTAKAQLDEIVEKAGAIDGKRSSLTVNVSSGTTKAELDDIIAKADELGIKNVSFAVKADTAEAKAKIDETDAKLDELGAKNPNARVSVIIGDALAKIAAVDGALSSLNGRMVVATVAIAGAGMALGALPGVLGLAAGAAGTGALAFGGLGKALSDSTKAANASGGASAAAASNAYAVAQAEMSLKNAEQSEQQAQESLTQARQQAILTLQQLNDDQKDAALGAEQAQLNLQQAIDNQRQVDANATSTSLQRAQADLSVREAQQSLVEAQQRAKNTTDAANKANKEGVNGLPAVVAAQQSYQKSIQGVAAAKMQLAHAEQQSASAGGGAASAARNFAQDMAKLTPEARKVVNQLIGMKSAFHSLQASAQKGVLPGVSVFLSGLQSLMPVVSGEVKAMGGILGNAFAGVGNALKSAGVQKELQAVFQEGNQFAKTLLPAVGGVASAFLKLGSESGPAVAGLSKGLSAILKGVTELLKGLGPGAGAFGSIFGNLGQIIGDLGKPLAALIVAFGTGLAPVLASLAPIVAGLANWLTRVIKALTPSELTAIVGALLGIVAAVKTWVAVQWLLNTALDANPIGLVITLVAGLVVGIALLWTHSAAFRNFFIGIWHDITGAVSDAVSFIKRNWENILLGVLTGPIGPAVKYITEHWSAITQGAGQMVNSVVSFFASLPGKFLNALGALATDMLNVGKNAIIGLWNGIASMGSWLWNQIVGFVKSFIMNPVKDVLSMFSPSKVFHGFGQFTMMGFINGVRSMHSAVRGTMTQTANMISDAFYGNFAQPNASGMAATARGSGGMVFAPHVTVTGVVGDAGATGKQIAKALNTYLRQTGQAQLVGA